MASKDRSPSYVQVYCHVDVSRLAYTPSQTEVTEFLQRLEDAVRRVRGEDGQKTLNELVQEVVMPNLGVFLKVGQELKTRGIEVGMAVYDWSYLGGNELTEEEIRTWLPDTQLFPVGSNRLSHPATSSHPHFSVEILPSNPSFLLPPKPHFNSLSVPFFPSTHPLDDFHQQRYFHCLVPFNAGVYDIDEVQVKLTRQFEKALPGLTQKVQVEVDRAVRQGNEEGKMREVGDNLEKRLDNWGNKEKIGKEEGIRQDFDEKMRVFNGIIEEETKLLEELLALKEEILPSSLSFQVISVPEYLPYILLTNNSPTPSNFLCIEGLDSSNHCVVHLPCPSLQANESVQILDSEGIAKAVESGIVKLQLGEMEVVLR